MNRPHPVTAQPLTAVEIDGYVGQSTYFEGLPKVRHVVQGRDGRVVVWLEDAEDREPVLDEQRPERSAEIEMHGPGAPCQAVLTHPRAQHVELFVDAMGDPVAAPRGWWRARIWLKAA